MRKIATIFCLIISLSVAYCTTIESLPPCVYADTECSTNIPLQAWSSELRHFKFTLDFNVASNNIAIAIGEDITDDGVLSANETDVSFGYDCGKWILCDNSGNAITEAANTNTCDKVVSFKMRISKEGVPLALNLTDNGMPFLSGVSTNYIKAFSPQNWNTIRLTTRGTESLSERLQFRYSEDGLIMILR